VLAIPSDHGVQFASWAFTKRAKDSGLLPSMGSIGDCYDNHDRVVLVADAGRTPRSATGASRIELANTIFDCIEIWHNHQRRHSAVGMLTPMWSRSVHRTPWPNNPIPDSMKAGTPQS